MNTPITNNAEYLALFIDLLKSLDIFILYYCNHFGTGILCKLYAHELFQKL